MKKILYLFILLLINSKIYSQNSETQKIVVKFLDTVQARALNSSNINWQLERPILIEKTKEINDLKKLVPIFNTFLQKLNDNHSGVMYLSDDDKSMYEKLATMTNKEAGQPEPNFKAKMLENKYAYILIPPVTYEQRKYVDSLQHHIKILDKKNPEGWILDFSTNTGGGYRPMIIPLNGFVNKKKTFSFVSKNNETISTQTLNKKRVYIENHKVLNRMKMDTLVSNKIKNSHKPIVIWTSGRTASSAEFAVAHLLGQKNVKTIGTITAGMNTGNSEIELSNNFMLFLTTALLKDRNKKIYQPGENIKPNVEIIPKNKKIPTYEEYLEKSLEILNKK